MINGSLKQKLRILGFIFFSFERYFMASSANTNNFFFNESETLLFT